MYTISQIRTRHNMNYCGRQEYKGINHTSDPNTIVLIHRNTSPYNDSYDGEVLYYDGEGLPEKGDQKMSHGNKKLSTFDGKCQVYWECPNIKDSFTYLGAFKVEDFSEDYSTGRLVYKFELHRLVKSWCTIQ